MATHKVTVKIWSVAGGIGPAGGDGFGLKDPGGLPLYRGSASVEGVTQNLEPLSWFGLGVSFKVISAEVKIECEVEGDTPVIEEVKLEGGTILLVSVVKVTIKARCMPNGKEVHEASDTSVNLGIGLEGFSSTWKVK